MTMLIRLLDSNKKELVYEIEKYQWNYIIITKQEDNKENTTYLIDRDLRPMKEDEIQGIEVKFKTSEKWEYAAVWSPGGYLKIIIEDSNKKVRDCFVPKKYNNQVLHNCL